MAGGSSLPLAILLVPASTNVAPDLRPGAGGAGTVRRGHGKPWRPVAPCLAALPVGEASSEPVVHGRGRDLSDTGPTTEGPVVDTLLSDEVGEAR